MAQDNQERRRFHRVATDKPVVVSSEGREFNGMVVDISLRGLLFINTDDSPMKEGQQVRAAVKLDDGLCCIDMNGTVAHVGGRQVGIRCTSLDIDSAATLRRMVELNLADAELLERDLSELVGNQAGTVSL